MWADASGPGATHPSHSGHEVAQDESPEAGGTLGTGSGDGEEQALGRGWVARTLPPQRSDRLGKHKNQAEDQRRTPEWDPQGDS